MKLYRSKHAVEAMQWTDTDENREAFAAWFEHHDEEFSTIGCVVEMPDNSNHWYAMPTNWIVRVYDIGWRVLADEQFRAEYEEVTT